MSTISVAPSDEVKNLQAQHNDALAAAETFIRKAEEQKLPLTRSEQQTIDAKLRDAADLKPRIEAAKKQKPYPHSIPRIGG